MITNPISIGVRCLYLNMFNLLTVSILGVYLNHTNGGFLYVHGTPGLLIYSGQGIECWVDLKNIVMP